MSHLKKGQTLELPLEMNHKIEKVSVMKINDGDVIIIRISKEWRKSSKKLEGIRNFFQALLKGKRISFGFDLGAIEGIKIIRAEGGDEKKELPANGNT
jgi:hypothetical protein